MRLAILFMLLLFISSSAFAKSLYSEAKSEISDTTIANNYFKKANDLTYQAKYDSANFYYEAASKIFEVLAKKHNDHLLWKKYIDCYNELGDNYSEQCIFDKADFCLGKALQLGQKIFGEQSAVVATSYFNMSQVFRFKGNRDKQREYVEKALTIRGQLFGENSLETAECFHALGTIETWLGNSKLSFECLDKSLSIRLNLVGEDHSLTAESYSGYYLYYIMLNDIDQALRFAEKALHLRLKLFGEGHPQVAASYYHIFICYGAKGYLEEALSYLKKSMRIRLNTFGENHISLIGSYTNMANISFDLGDYNKAIEYHRKSQRIKKKLFGENVYGAASYRYLGNIFFKISEFDSAQFYLQKSIDLHLKLGIPSRFDLAGSYLDFAFLKHQNKSYEISLSFANKAIETLLPGFNFRKVADNPQLIESHLLTFLIPIIGLKAKAYHGLYWNKTRDIEDIFASLKSSRLAIRLIDRFRQEYFEKEARFNLAKESSEIFDQAIKTAIELYEITDQHQYQRLAFDFDQQVKAAVFSLALKESEALKFSGIPEDQLINEQSIKKDLAELNIDIQNESKKGEDGDSLKIMELKDRHFELFRKYKSLITDFEKLYPKYYEIKYGATPISVNTLQEKMDHQSALLDYFVGETSISIFTITKDNFEVYHANIDSTFIELAAAFTAYIKADRKEKYLEAAAILYDHLIAPFEANIRNKRNLVIIPHGVLNKVPFDALISHKPESKVSRSTRKVELDYSDLDYLIKQYNISYHYSATLYLRSLQQQKPSFADASNAFIGFAPVFNAGRKGSKIAKKSLFDNYLSTLKDYVTAITRDGENFCELPYSETEVQQIASEFESKKMKGTGCLIEEATEGNFKHDISNYKYVHLATHSFVNEDTPGLSGIAFFQPEDVPGIKQTEDGILYLDETYNLNLNADLVVLSSCESGIGKIIEGEGMIALTRGFLYSGAKNIIVSLWKIHDKYTSEMMVEFYRELLNGKSYAEALRQAKLNLIKNNESAKPVVWSGFVLIGK